MKTNPPIPEHELNDKTKDPFFVWKVFETIKVSKRAGVVHRDKYFMVFIIIAGEAEMKVDFNYLKIESPSIFYIRPGQVHQVLSLKDVNGWMMALDMSIIHDAYMKVLMDTTIDVEPIPLVEDLRQKLFFQLLDMLSQTTNSFESEMGIQMKKDMINSCMGMIADCYYATQIQEKTSSRIALIYKNFRILLTQSFKQLRMPRDYATQLNLSPAYLNEAVKKASGATVSFWITQEIILEAKRLLIYSDLSVKEICYQLGYDDPAYFSRIFSKFAKCSPIDFRVKNHE